MGNKNFYATLRNLFYVFCVWVLFNHAVRISATRVSTKGGDALSYAIAATVKSLDAFRKKTGDVIGRLKGYCPESMEEGCHNGVDMIRDGFGVK